MRNDVTSGVTSGISNVTLKLLKKTVVSSVPSKYSTRRIFLLNSFTSSVSCSGFPIGGVGVNFSPLFNNDFSVVFNCLFDKLIILTSLISLSFIACWVGDRDCVLDRDLDLGRGLGPDPGPDPGPELKNTAVLHSVLHHAEGN